MKIHPEFDHDQRKDDNSVYQNQSDCLVHMERNSFIYMYIVVHTSRHTHACKCKHVCEDKRLL